MRQALKIVLVVVIGVAMFFGVLILASESGEVVTLRTADADGKQHATRLWVVDHGGTQWVRTGHPEKRWFVRLLSNPHVELERGDTASTRIAVPVRDPAIAEAVNAEFARKYGAADWIVALSGDASNRVPVRLDSVPP